MTHAQPEHIHLNHAGASLMPPSVVAEILAHLEWEAKLGGYEAHDHRIGRIEEAYRAVEALIGAPEGTVAFQENATVAFAQALSAIPFREGDLILTTRNDYVSNQIMFLSLQERFGIRVERAPDRPEGGVDADALIELVHRRRPRLVSMSHIPTSSGLVQEVGPVAEACRERGIPFLLDACQSIGQMPVDVGEIPCTFLAATARKFLRGPRGSGFLYIDQEALDAGLTPLFPDLRGADWIDEDLVQPAPDARRFENWEFAWALVLGTGEAARIALETGLETIREGAWGRAARLRELLASIPGARVLDRGETLGAIVTVEFEAARARDLVPALRASGVHSSWVHRSSALFDYEEKGVEEALRLSPHHITTDEELATAVERIGEVLGRLRGSGTG